MKPRILLLACYELGHQPLSLAWPLAFLQRAGYTANVRDLSVESFSDDEAAQAAFVGIAAPMHTALRLGAQAAARIRALNPRAHISFFGLYAHLNADFLLGGQLGGQRRPPLRTGDRLPRHLSPGQVWSPFPLADSVLAGEYETSLLDLIRALEHGGNTDAVPGVSTVSSRAAPLLSRLSFPVPDRSALPPLDRYAHYSDNGHSGLAGYVEASRGCLHTCRHCPVVPVYGGRFFVVPPDIVLADIRQQVEAGARHITFGDPDFLNGPGHALNVARALHAEFPRLTFDFTAKVEHILKHRELFPQFAELGCTFVVSAIESVSNRVLERLAKGHTAADIDEALAIMDSAAIALQPTLVAFTPWTTLDEYLAQIEFIRERGLVSHIPPIQLSIRLLVPPGSALLSAPDTREWLGELEAEAFSYRWIHPDPRVDRLHEQVVARVELAGQCSESVEETFEAIRALAYRAAGRALPTNGRHRVRPVPPRLTEDWFC